MKILVIGLGSMGKRRITLLFEISKELEIVGVDTQNERCENANSMFGIETFNTLDHALERTFDCIIISTSPLTHSALIRRLLPLNTYIFTEINLVQDGYKEFMNDKNSHKLFLSSTFLYRKDIEFICEQVKNQPVIYSYHVGQYLPDWHPWECYKDFFVADIRTNGCREIMAIDFPWLVEAFGKIIDFTVKKEKLSKLDINYNDNFLLLVEHENGTKGSIIIDVLSRKAIRKLEVFNEDIHIFWDGTPDSLTMYDSTNNNTKKINCYDEVEKNPNYSDNIIENAYKDELMAFLELVINNSRTQVRYSLQQDEEILNLIDLIEK